MPWPPRQPTRSEIEEQELEAYDLVIKRSRDHLKLPDPENDAGFRGRLLLSPSFAALQSEMGRVARSLGDRGDSYSHAQREFADILLCKDLKTNVVGAKHFVDAVASGVRIEAIRAIRAGREEELDEEERQLADFIRKVSAGQMDRGSWEAMEARMGERGTLEYAVFVLHLVLTMRLMTVVGVREPSDAEIDVVVMRLGEEAGL